VRLIPYITNLLEENQVPLTVEDGQRVTLSVKPFQIITVRLVPAWKSASSQQPAAFPGLRKAAG
jgi:hypothetical protein